MAKKRSAKKPGSVPRKKVAAGKREPAGAKAARPTLRKRTAAKPAARSSVRAAAVVNPVRDLARRIVDLTVNHQEESAFALYADTIESVEPGMPPAVGMEAIRRKLVQWRGFVSDAQWQARNVWVDGNTIIIEWAGRITITATGKQVDFREVAIHEVANGKIVRERFYYDRSALQP